MPVTLLTTEIEKIMDALAEKQFTGGIINIIVLDEKEVVLRDKNNFLIASWKRQLDDELEPRE